MFLQKAIITKTKDIKNNFVVISIFLVLVLMSFFSVINLITVINLQTQTKNIINKALAINRVKYNKVSEMTFEESIENVVSTTTLVSTLTSTSTLTLTSTSTSTGIINTATKSIIEEPIAPISATIVPEPLPVISPTIYDKSPEVIKAPLLNTPISNSTAFIYSNATSEPFFSSYYIDTEKTNMFLDSNITALTFEPKYELKGTDCSSNNCNLTPTSDLTSIDNEIYYKDRKVSLPKDLQGKKIINFTFSKLTSKWIVGVVVNENNYEAGYVYVFDGNNFEKLMSPETNPHININYIQGGGSISAGGSDDQFMILYSGYETIGYVYNNGSWQDISSFFSLRIGDGGFKSKIIRGGSKDLANWYICSNDPNKSKLIKLWQNKTNKIQGAIDLTRNLKRGAAICSYKGDRELNIARSSKEAYIFKDNGFDNSHAYTYQSNNLSSYFDKNIITVNLNSYVINADSNKYSLFVSSDNTNWQPYQNKLVTFKNKNLNTFFVKATFKPGSSEYSPWFGGFDLISYTAQDK
jgi:hypothetical protein